MKKPDVKKTRIKKTLYEDQNWLMSTNLDEIVSNKSLELLKRERL